MGVAAAVCGATAFLAVRRLEADLGEQTHQSVAASALKGAQAITRGRLEGAGVISLQHSFQFPNASDWPFAFMKGFVKIANKLSLVEDSMPSGVGVILQLEQILDFEKFAQEAYQTNGYPDRAGVSDFGFGMWAFDKSDTRRYPDGRVHDINGTISSLVDSKYNVAAPLLQNSNLSSTSLMFNLYSENVRRNALDLTLDCAAEANINAEAEIPMCSLFSEMITLISKSGPAALLLIPVFPINDPTAIVAVAVATLDFADVLTDTVPDYVDGLYYFLSSESKTFTL